MVFCGSVVFGHKLIVVRLGAWIGDGRGPEGGREDIISGRTCILLKLREGESGRTAHKELGVEVEFLGLPHQK